MRANSLATAGATAALMVGPVLALAGDDLRDDTVSTCTGTNCSSLKITWQCFGFRCACEHVDDQRFGSHF